MSDNDTLFEEYLGKNKGAKHFFKTPRSWLLIFGGILFVIILVAFYKSVIVGTWSKDDVMASITVTWADAKWVVKESTPYGVSIVPSVSFKIKNTGKKPLQYVSIEGVFKFIEDGKVHSDGGVHAFKEPLEPGQVSEPLFIKALNGFQASTIKSFKNHPGWKKMRAELFARTQGSPSVPICKPYEVKQEIEGHSFDETADTGQKDTELKTGASSESFEKLGKSIQVIGHDSLWVDRLRKKGKAIIVPSIIFQVKNLGKAPIKDVIFKGEFLFQDNDELLGEAVTMAFKKELPPGEVSDDILIRAPLGYEATSKEAFLKNKTNWRKAKVRIHVKTRDLDYVILGTFPIKQEIEGLKAVYQIQ